MAKSNSNYYYYPGDFDPFITTAPSYDEGYDPDTGGSTSGAGSGSSTTDPETDPDTNTDTESTTSILKYWPVAAAALALFILIKFS